MSPASLLASGRLAGRPVLSTQSDERLLELARAGSAAAFEELVERYRPLLLRYCLGFLPPDRAEDAVQQTFMRAFERVRTLESELHLRAWLYRVAHNNAIDGLRDRGFTHSELDEGLDGVERLDQTVERREQVRSAIGAVQALPTRQRDAVVLREFEGRSYAEISTTLGVTASATRQLLARARKTIRASAAAIVPAPLLHFGNSSSTFATRATEVCAHGGTIITQIGVSTLVTGTLAAGIVLAPAVPDSGPGDPAGARGAAAPGAIYAAPFQGRQSDPAGAPQHRKRAAADPAASTPAAVTPKPPVAPVPAPALVTPTLVEGLTPTDGETDGASQQPETRYGVAPPGQDGAVESPTPSEPPADGDPPPRAVPEQEAADPPPDSPPPGTGTESPPVP